MQVFNHPALARAKRGLRKNETFVARPRLFIRRKMVREILLWVPEGNDSLYRVAVLFALTYAFLLRLPSEALPIALDSTDSAGQAELSIEGDEAVLKLKTRKNRVRGSVLTRKCWCQTCEVTCPVHLVKKLKDKGISGPLFAHISPHRALEALKLIMSSLGVQNSEQYRTHDLRRGHAQDLVESRAPLYEILKAGEWRSPAFLNYLEWNTLEKEAVIQAHVDDSDSD